MPASVELRGVSVNTPAGDPILRDISISIAAGEAVAFIGRSGAGKTTALRLINGLVGPARGEVVVDGVPLTATDVIALRRKTGYIIQGSGLFPHRTVFDNIATVPRLQGWPEEQIRAAARELMEKVSLPFDRFATRWPRSLSGGEQQRVGIVRAMISRPGLLLCDEPFAALDPIVRRELQDVLRALRGDTTVVFVTHDLAEAMRIASRVVVFDEGAIAADVPARDIVRDRTPIVQRFVASATLPAEVA
jgi:osmoprotectant transport system ATP-binding protein